MNFKIRCVTSSLAAIMLLSLSAGAQGPGPGSAQVVVTNNGGSAAEPVRIVGRNGDAVVVKGAGTGGTVPVTGTDPGGNVPVSIKGIPTVNLGNTAANPALVRSVEGIEPAQFRLDACFASGDTHANSSAYGVPSSKRLVIQHVSLYGQLHTAGQRLNVLLVVTDYPTFAFVHQLVPTLLGNFPPDGELFAAAGPVVMYADAGNAVGVSARRTDGADVGCLSVNVTGYLVPMP
jgi:hypothetical protein